MSTLFSLGTERRTVRTEPVARSRRSSVLRAFTASFAMLGAACGGDDPIAVDTVTVTPATASISIAGTQQLAAAALDASGGVISGRAVTWSTSNASTATVSGAGLVTGVAAGTVSITATVAGKSGTAAVTVLPPPVATVAITPTAPSVVESDTVRLRTVLTIAGGAVVTGRTVTWSSASPAVATVNASGLVTGVIPGTSVITATSEGKTATATVTVTQSPCNIGLALPVTSGVPVTGTLAATDCDFGDGTYLDIYKFDLPAQQTLEVRMRSTVFDAYLFIYRVNTSTLTKVGENDDADSTSTDARLSGSLSAGSYIIVANGFNVSATGTLLSAFGAYTLTFTSPFTAAVGAPSALRATPDVTPLTRLSPAEARAVVRGLVRRR